MLALGARVRFRVVTARFCRLFTVGVLGNFLLYTTPAHYRNGAELANRPRVYPRYEVRCSHARVAVDSFDKKRSLQ